jgi:hypothetical protein
MTREFRPDSFSDRDLPVNFNTLRAPFRHRQPQRIRTGRTCGIAGSVDALRSSGALRKPWPCIGGNSQTDRTNDGEASTTIPFAAAALIQFAGGYDLH